MEVTGKEEKRETKEKILDVVKEDMGEVGAKETDVEDRTVWKDNRCDYPCLKGKTERRRRICFK